MAGFTDILVDILALHLDHTVDDVSKPELAHITRRGKSEVAYFLLDHLVSIL